MTLSIDASDAITKPRLERRVMLWLSLAAVFVGALVLRHLVPANNDVSWLLTAGDQILAGRKLYSEVIETNPPIAVFTYIPATLIAHLIGVAAETVVDALVFVAIAGSLACSVRILQASAFGRKLPTALLVLAFVILAVVPLQEFGQREHIALIAFVPMMAALMIRAERETPRPWAIVVAGLGAAIMLAFKPHFALGFFGASALIAVRQRNWRLLVSPENLIAGFVFVAYVAGIALVFPNFFAVIGPLAKDVYIPVGQPFTTLVSESGVSCWLAAVLITFLLRRHAPRAASVAALLAVSFGYAAVFFLQRKGWPYHAYPMIAVALFACGVAMVSSPLVIKRQLPTKIAATAALVILIASATIWFRDSSNPSGLVPRLAKFGPDQAVLVVSGEAGIGHPVVREIHGRWVSRENSLWVTNFVRYMKQHGMVSADNAPALDRYVARERTWLIEDIKREPPTIVLIDNHTGQWGAWLRADAELSALLASYKKVDTFDNVDILTRGDAASTLR
jgi:hypothetical protein